MSCSECMRRLIQAERARIQLFHEEICGLIEQLREKGWDADAFFSQDGRMVVRIRRREK